MRKFLKNSIVCSIRFYRNYLSQFKLQSCRFYPTCSEYALDCLEKYGVTRGIFKSLGRILRCHPFNKGGYDPA